MQEIVMSCNIFMQNELVMQLLVINSLVYLLFNSSIIIIIKLKVKLQQTVIIANVYMYACTRNTWRHDLELHHLYNINSISPSSSSYRNVSIG